MGLPRVFTGRRSVVDWPARLLLAAIMLVSNGVGGVVVILMALFVLPAGPALLDPTHARTVNLIMVPSYLVLAIPAGILWITFGFRAHPEDTRRERMLVLFGPLRLSVGQGVAWMLAAVLFGVVNARTSSLELGISVGETVLIGGISTSALAYLVAERVLRSSATRVLQGTAPDPPRLRAASQVGVRFVLFWMLGTAVPVSGLLAAGLGALEFRDSTASELAVLVLVVGGAALLTGFLTTVGAARAVADPVRTLRRALLGVERGDLDSSVPVYDVSELGQLQAGFNNMVAGLRERDRIRELFGRQVGREVATVTEAASEVRLGGEVREVAVLFIDLVGSTSLAAERDPRDVVALLNQFFAVVVEVVETNQGWINKFEGDAALAVFGAPGDLPDAAGHALRAARGLSGRLARDVPGVSAGIGVSAGRALAGYVGGLRRYEYTVIGDPVNEAARLTELAKSVPGGVLAAGAALRAAGAREAEHWRLGDAVVLRGRSEPTRLASVAVHGAPSTVT
jgi:adenylate cyclase